LQQGSVQWRAGIRRRRMRVQLSPSRSGRRRAPRKAITGSLFAATATLLGSPSGPSIAQEANRKWAVDASVSYYGEQDRVTDGSVNLLASYRFRRGLASLRLAF